MRSTLRPLVAEFVGTFFLCFVGIGAVISETYRAGTIGVVGIALAHGIALAVAVSATMNISGGHLNPAVTIASLSLGRIDAVKAGQYIVAQLLGAVVAVFALKGLYPEMAGQVAVLGAPRVAPDVSSAQAIVIEAILTFMLAFAIMGTAVDPRAPKIGGFGIGLVVTFDILAGGLMTGAAMNPARAFGPMLVAWEWQGALIYWIGPILGAVVGAQLYDRLIMEKQAA